MNEIQKYIELLAAEKIRVEELIANFQRSLSRIEGKLKDPARWYEIENKRGSRKALQAKGGEVKKRKQPARKTKTEVPPPPAEPPTIDLFEGVDSPFKPKEKTGFFKAKATLF